MADEKAVPSDYKPNYYPKSGSSIYRPGFVGVGQTEVDGEQTETKEKKYPSSNSKILSNLSVPVESKNKNTIDLNGKDGFIFNMKESYLTRVKAFANAAIFANAHNPKLTDVERRMREKAVHELVRAEQRKLDKLEKNKNKNLNDAAKHAYINSLYTFFIDELPKASKVRAKDLALAESFFVWQHTDRPTHTTSFKWNGLTIKREDIPDPSPLTDPQKKELIKIHDEENPPKWFKKLPEFAQHYLKQIVPAWIHGKDKEKGWTLYEKWRPTTLRSVPGEVNPSKHVLTISNEKGEVLPQTESRKAGAPSNYKMKDGKERQNNNTQNMQEGIDPKIEKMREAQLKYWGLSEGVEVSYNVKLPIISAGLISTREQTSWGWKPIDAMTALIESEHDWHMGHNKDVGFEEFEETLKDYKPARLFNLNAALNDHRKTIDPDPEFLRFANEFSFNVAMARGDGGSIKGDFALKLTKLRKAIAALEAVNGLPEIPGRNKNLYIAACYDVVTRLMGGVSTGHCKSSKDRKGAETDVADAMLIYYEKYKQFPQYNDEGDNRLRYVDLVCALQASAHAASIAHYNSPGSPGIKLGNILDRDITDRLKTLGVTERTKELAELNKPGTLWQKHWVQQPSSQRITRLLLAVVASALIIPTIVLTALQGISFAATALGTIPGVTVGAGLLDKIMSPLTEAGKLFFGQANIAAGFGAFALVAAVVVPLIAWAVMTRNTHKTSKVNFETQASAKSEDAHKHKDSVFKDFLQGFLKFCTVGLGAFSLGAVGFAVSKVQLFDMSPEVGAYVTPGLGIAAASLLVIFGLKQLFDYAKEKHNQIPAAVASDSPRDSSRITDLQIQIDKTPSPSKEVVSSPKLNTTENQFEDNTENKLYRPVSENKQSGENNWLGDNKTLLPLLTLDDSSTNTTGLVTIDLTPRGQGSSGLYKKRDSVSIVIQTPEEVSQNEQEVTPTPPSGEGERVPTPTKTY